MCSMCKKDPQYVCDCCCFIKKKPGVSVVCGQCAEPVGVCSVHVAKVKTKWHFYLDASAGWRYFSNLLCDKDKLLCKKCLGKCCGCGRVCEAGGLEVCSFCFKVSCADCGKFKRVATSQYRDYNVCAACGDGPCSKVAAVFITGEIHREASEKCVIPGRVML